ncbi:MAG: acyl-CoA dehydrogenase family protein [Sphingomonas sp.]
MDFAKSDIQTMILDSAERLLAETSGVEYWREQRHQPFGFDESRWAQFAELGWLALPLPEAAGGLGGSVIDVALLNVALGKALATEPYVTVVLAAHVLGQATDSAKAGELLGELAAGSLRIALAHREQGDDPLVTTSRATIARADGDGYVLDGAKILAADVAGASRLIVSARIDGDEGAALFLVPADAAGVTIDDYPLIDGTRSADIRFERVALARDALIVGANHCAEILNEAIDRASVALMAQAVGAMEASVKICGAYAAERRQFGQPIGQFQSIQHILADIFVAAHQARSMLYHALANFDAPAADRGAALSAARIVIGEAGQTVSRQGIQVHGGYGLTDEYAISHYFRRLLSLEKQNGDLIGHTTRFGDMIFA